MNRILAIAAAAFTVTITQTASAQSVDPWNGFYLGLTAGYLDGRIDEDEFDEGEFEDSYRYDANEITGGALAGYNHALSGNWVVGGEIEALFGGTYAYDENEPDDEYYFHTDAVINLRGRLGYRVSDSALVYGALGPSFARFELDWDDGETDRQKVSATGGTIAAGLEYAVSDGISLRGELRHTRYSLFSIETDLFPGFEYEQDLRNNAAMLAVTIQTSRLGF